MFFCFKQSPTNYLYSKPKILKIDDMITIKNAKFIFKFNNYMLSNSFNLYFTKLDKVQKYNAKQKQRNNFFQFRISFQSGRKILHHTCLNVWKN